MACPGPTIASPRGAHRICGSLCTVRACIAAVVAALALLSHPSACLEVLSRPVLSDADVEVPGNEFTRARPDSDPDHDPHTHGATLKRCDRGLNLKWMTETAASVYATPLITDLRHDGVLDIVVPTFVENLEALEGPTGARPPGFPATFRGTTYSSPFMLDVEVDGTREVAVISYDGVIHYFTEFGEPRPFSTTYIAPLRVELSYLEGLVASQARGPSASPPTPPPADHLRRLQSADMDGAVGVGVQRGEGVADGGTGNTRGAGDGEATRQLTQAPVDVSTPVVSDAGSYADEPDVVPGADDENFWGYWGGLFSDGEELPAANKEVIASIQELIRDTDLCGPSLPSPPHARPAPYPHEESAYLPPKVLAAPAQFTFYQQPSSDSDPGAQVLVVPVSWQFDEGRAYWDKGAHEADLPVGEAHRVSSFVAAGLVAVEARTRRVRWSRVLDLSSKGTRYQARMFSTPSVVDMDADGRPEIIAATGTGRVYVLDAAGRPMPGWPVQMGEVQAQPLVADVAGKGSPQVLVADMNGNLVVFDMGGGVVWKRHLATKIATSPVAGDVDGDGALEVLLAGSDGRVHVLRGATGEEAPGFPFQTAGQIMAPLSLVRAPVWKRSLIAAASFDGHLYLIDSAEACADRADVGEVSYAMPLVEDLDGDGAMEVVLATMNGNVFAFETNVQAHPILAVRAPSLPNGPAIMPGWRGAAATPASRAYRDVRGQTVTLQIDVVDAAWRPGMPGDYNLQVMLDGINIEAMNDGDEPKIGMVRTCDKPGTYTVEIPAPKSRVSGGVIVTLEDRHSNVFTDEFTLSFHIHFYRLFKWMLAGPVLLGLGAMLVLAVREDVWAGALPSLARDAGAP